MKLHEYCQTSKRVTNLTNAEERVMYNNVYSMYTTLWCLQPKKSLAGAQHLLLRAKCGHGYQWPSQPLWWAPWIALWCIASLTIIKSQKNIAWGVSAFDYILPPAACMLKHCVCWPVLSQGIHRIAEPGTWFRSRVRSWTWSASGPSAKRRTAMCQPMSAFSSAIGWAWKTTLAYDLWHFMTRWHHMTIWSWEQYMICHGDLRANKIF